MKISTGVGLSILLASTAEACTRVLVKEVWQSETKRTRDLTLWDDEMSEGVQLKWGGALNDGTSREQWSGQGYWAGIYQNNDGGQVQYPNKRSSNLYVQDRKQSTLENGRTQVYYCMWDDYKCGNYECGIP